MNLRRTAAFTLVEVIVATGVLLLVVSLLLGAVQISSSVLHRTSGRIEQFREARQAYESMTRRLAEATLNTYWDYEYQGTGLAKSPKAYTRQSELRFRSGPMNALVPADAIERPTHGVFFQAPIGETQPGHDLLDQALNTWGYFLEIGSDRDSIPKILHGRVPERFRSRLLEVRESTEFLSVYEPVAENPHWWFADTIRSGPSRPVRVLAQNIVALVVLPRLSRAEEIERGSRPLLSPDYGYDSTRSHSDPDINPKHQLPPLVQVVMIAIDEDSARRLAETYADDRDLGIRTSDLFQKSRLLEDDPGSPESGDGDLWTLETRLIERRANYRIFSSNISIRGAKWSRAQIN